MWTVHKGGQLLPPIADIKNGGSYNSIIPYALMACRWLTLLFLSDIVSSEHQYIRLYLSACHSEPSKLQERKLLFQNGTYGVRL
jgi:hypothetical protein